MMTRRHRLNLLSLVLTVAVAGLGASTASAASTAATDFTYSSAPTVAQAQGILQHLGFLSPGSYKRGEMDGATVEALTRFQRTHALPTTGQVDGETLTQLLQHQPATVGGPLVLKGVRFELNSSTLDSESLPVLDRVARSLRANPHVSVQIGGHSDSTGTAEGNKRLSEARARSVRDYLVSQGVPSSRLSTRGYGSRQPIADNGTRAGRAENRRVELSRLS